MLISSSKSRGIFLTFFALLILFLTHRHAAESSVRQTEMGFAFETSDQTVIGGVMTELQETIVYDKRSGDTPSDTVANWSATIGAKTLLQKVREFRLSTQASYTDVSKKGVRKVLEDAELELEILGKDSFDTKKIVQGVQKLRAALKAAEEVMARGPASKSMTSTSVNWDEAAMQVEQSRQEAERDKRAIGILRRHRNDRIQR